MSTDLKPDQYRCAACGGVFTKGWSDEEAALEMREHFGEVPVESQAIVCEDCYQKIKPENNPVELSRYKASKN